MKRVPLATIILIAIVITSCTQKRDEMFQYSVITALQGGFYDGDITIGELKERGDFGIGTFNALDGEMAAINGQFFQILSDGSVRISNDSLKSPFAAVLFFKADTSFKNLTAFDFGALSSTLDSLLVENNRIYAFKVSGTFSKIKVRSVPRQSKPYPPLVEVTANQPVFNYENEKGTLVGFRLPEYLGGINVTGYHLHFIAENRKTGGHLLSFENFKGVAEVASVENFNLSIPPKNEFSSVNLNRDKEEILKIEK